MYFNKNGSVITKLQIGITKTPKLRIWMQYETELQFETRANQKMERSLADTGLIVPVQDQGSCGSCYAFAALAAVSAAYARLYKKLILLSAQHVIDTIDYDDPPPPEDKCGCLPNHHYFVFELLMKYGVHLNSDYEYEFKRSRTSSKLEKDVKEYPMMKIGNLVKIHDSMSDKVEYAIKIGQPIVASIMAGRSLRKLKPGVIYQGMTEKDKKKRHGGHAVLIIGYGVDENGVKYLIIQSSWNTWWCDKGRGLIRRDLAKELMYPEDPKLYEGKDYKKAKYEVNVEEYIPEEYKGEPGDDDMLVFE